MSDELSGISGVGDDIDSDDIDSRIRGISNLEDLAEFLSDEDVLRGIDKIVGGKTVEGDIGKQVQHNISPEITIEKQLSELEEINDQIDLLRGINRSILELSERVNTTNETLLDVVQAASGAVGADIIDIDYVTISEAERKEDLTEVTGVRTSEIKVKADPSNDGFLYIGKDSVSIRDGYKLEPGESEPFGINLENNILKVISEEPNESYSYITKRI